MKITIENFGPISHFSIDLKKDFNLFVGKNSVGKSYASTVVYLVLKSLLDEQKYSMLLNLYLFEETEYFKTVVNGKPQTPCPLHHWDLMESFCSLPIGESMEITDLLIKDLKFTLSPLCTAIAESLKGTYSSLENLKNHFSGKSPVITLQNDILRMKISVSDSKLAISEIKLKKTYVQKVDQDKKKKETKSRCTIYCTAEHRSHSLVQHLLLHPVVNVSRAFLRCTKELVGEVHYLPASRSGLYQALSAFGQIVAELSRKRTNLTKKIALPGIPEPLSDYFVKLSSIVSSRQPSLFNDENVAKIATDIENTILDGEVRFDSDTKQLKFTPKQTKLELDLSVTSSMVSEIAPIVAYLRDIIAKDTIIPKENPHLIIMEEPEAHLHPGIQVKLCLIFSKLIKANIKLLITTHSSYIFNKVNNLIMSKDIDVDAINIEMFKQTKKGSKLQSLDLNEFGAEDENFADTIADLFDEKMEIVDSLNSAEITK